MVSVLENGLTLLVVVSGFGSGDEADAGTFSRRFSNVAAALSASFAYPSPPKLPAQPSASTAFPLKHGLFFTLPFGQTPPCADRRTDGTDPRLRTDVRTG